MMKIKKDYNAGLLKLVFVIDTICVILFFTGILYAFSSTNDTLRLPIGKEDDTYDRMKTKILGQSRDDNAGPSKGLLKKLSPRENEVSLICSLKINKGDRVIEVGGGSLVSAGSLVLAHGANYIGVEINKTSSQYAKDDMKTRIERYNLLRYGGTAEYVNDDFVAYAKNNVTGDTIRFIIAIAVISEHMASIDEQGKIFKEMLRIVQNRGEIILGRFPTTIESRHEERVINSILNSERYGQKVRLTLIAEGPLYGGRTYSRYLVIKEGHTGVRGKIGNTKGPITNL